MLPPYMRSYFDRPRTRESNSQPGPCVPRPLDTEWLLPREPVQPMELRADVKDPSDRRKKRQDQWINTGSIPHTKFGKGSLRGGSSAPVLRYL
mmetsp:Transcript_63055/g.145102  ORF Transcript_63055/g.145102 Transcript_63055/m.145102 type:complete len:93 (-) Transcript_63055:57-335(-)